MLFWINGFVWTYDPRKVDEGQDPNLPFITWECQDRAFAELSAGIGKCDFAIRKSRDMGASSICLATFKHRFQFSKQRESFMMVSRTGNLVDNGDDPDTLFWKLDYIDEWSPEWLVPKIRGREFNRYNVDNKCVIDGAKTTGDAGRGGRRTAFFIDEHNAFDTKEGYAVMTATQHNTNCRVVNGTTKGVGTAFHQICTSKTMKFKKVELWWWMHPDKAKGLYLDEQGRKRSPWYDLQCERAVNIRTDVGAELDGDFHAAEYQFYAQEMIESYRNEFCLPPFLCGDLYYDLETGMPKEFVEDPNGMIRLWCQRGADGRPISSGNLGQGADISLGTGASDSTMTMLDLSTGEKLAEAGDPFMDPNEWGVFCTAVAIWFGSFEAQECRMIWEAPGPGLMFGKTVRALGYRSIFYRRDEDAVGANDSNVPGWWPNKKTRMTLHSEYRKALKERRFINRSERALEDCKSYVNTAESDVVHSGAENAIDPTGASSNHGDFCVADALANRLLGTILEPSRAATETKVVPMDCYLSRRREYLSAKQADKGRW
jgi:hypothetical protein